MRCIRTDLCIVIKPWRSRAIVDTKLGLQALHRLCIRQLELNNKSPRGNPSPVSRKDSTFNTVYGLQCGAQVTLRGHISVSF